MRRKPSPDVLETDSIYKVWRRSVGLGLFAAMTALYFANMLMFNVRGESFIAWQFPKITTNSLLGVYALLATVIVALAFSKRGRHEAPEQEFDEIERQVQENTIVLIVAQLVSIFAVAAATIYGAGRIAHNLGNIEVRDIFSILSMLFFGVIFALIGSIVVPTKNHFYAQAQVELPSTIARLKRIRIRSYKSIGQSHPEMLSRNQKARLFLSLVLLPIVTLVSSFLLIARIWGTINFPVIAFWPLLFMLLFYFAAYFGVMIASIGATSAFNALRWLARCVLFLLILYPGYIVLKVDFDEYSLQHVIFSSALAFITALILITPWVCMRIPSTVQKTYVVSKPVYFLRVHIFSQLIGGLEKHRRLHEDRIALFSSSQH